MKKTIFITGSTDGLGLETAKMLASQGHHVILHGRNAEKLKTAVKALSLLSAEPVEGHLADLSSLDEVAELAKSIVEKHTSIDVLINNAGVFKTPEPIAQNGLDVRFVVNTFAPYLLTQKLLPIIPASGRVINLSSAAQSSVDINALLGKVKLTDNFNAYAQSKLAITMWSRSMALALKDKGPVIIAVNPGSLLATKMVKEGFGMAGNDIRIGAEILIRAAFSDEFSTASGMYFDNDLGQFASPHADAMDQKKSEEVVQTIESICIPADSTQ